MIGEELLSAWLQLTSVINNQRLVDRQAGLSFNEAMICGLLAGAQRQGEFLTASDLCARTRILKSQMNAILRVLEQKGAVSRQRSRRDRRLVELRLLPEGLACYEETHRRVLAVADALAEELGEDAVRTLLPLLRRVADIFYKTCQEV